MTTPSGFLSIVIGFLLLVGGQNQTPAAPPADAAPLVFSNLVKHDDKAQSTLERTLVLNDRFDCQDCHDFALKTWPEIRQTARSEGLTLELHVLPKAGDDEYGAAVQALYCAKDQNALWLMHEALHRYYTDWKNQKMSHLAEVAGLNVATFNDCMKTEKYAAKIDEEAAYFNARPLADWPTLDIAPYELRGNQPLENIKKVLKDLHYL